MKGRRQFVILLSATKDLVVLIRGENNSLFPGDFTDAESDVADDLFPDSLVDPFNNLPLHEFKLLHPG